MAKLKLAPEDLRVESFRPSDALPHRGTVNAHSAGTGCNTDDACCWAGTHGGGTCDSTCHQRLCTCTYGPGTETCHVSCEGTCRGQGDTCYAGCVTYLNCPSEPGYPGC